MQLARGAPARPRCGWGRTLPAGMAQAAAVVVFRRAARARPASTAIVAANSAAARYPVQPSSLMAQPAFQILVIWLILPSWNFIT